MTNIINSLAAASFSDFMSQSVVGGLTMWMVIAITAVIVVICIILIAIISKSGTKKAKKKAEEVIAVGDDSAKPDRPSEPVEAVNPPVVPDVTDTASAPEEVALTEASTNAEAAQAEEKIEETPAEEKPVEEVPVAEEKPVEEVPVAEEKAEEPAPVVEEKAEEPAPVVEEKVEEPAPVVEEKAAEPAPAVEEKPAETESKKVVKPPVKKAVPAKKQPPVRKPAPKPEPAPASAGDVKNNITLLFGDAPEPSNGKYVIIKDNSNPIRPYKYQLKANNGQILYESEGYKIKPKAKQIDGFRNTINNGTYTIDEEKNGTFRYKIFKVDGTMYGVGEGYKSRAAAESAIESVKKFANNANFIEDSTITDSETK